MADKARQQLALMQAELVRALVEGTEAPADFDRQRLRAAAETLWLKRARAVARAWPQLVGAMGDAFTVGFANYGRANPLPQGANPLVDGRAFAGWLERAGLLTDEGRLEAFAFDARYRIRQNEIIRRRRPVLRFLRLKALRRLIIVVRLPGLDERWLNYKFL
jgi:hypothetical protein